MISNNNDDELSSIDISFNSLKNQFYSVNSNFVKSIDNFFTELNILKNNYIEKNLEVDKILYEINLEKQELNKKNNELEEFKKVSFISSIHKRLDEKEYQFANLQKKYNILEKQHNKNSIISSKNSSEETNILKINHSHLSNNDNLDKIEQHLSNNDNLDKIEQHLSNNDNLDKIEQHLSNNDNLDKIEQHLYKNDNLDKIEQHLSNNDNLDKIEQHLYKNDNLDKIDEIQLINNIEKSINDKEQFIKNQDKFNDFEAEIDGKIYIFSIDNYGKGVYFKKLKNGTISKKISGNWKEDSNGELIID